jgi:hypothetical protein
MHKKDIFSSPFVHSALPTFMRSPHGCFSCSALTQSIFFLFLIQLPRVPALFFSFLTFPFCSASLPLLPDESPNKHRLYFLPIFLAFSSEGKGWPPFTARVSPSPLYLYQATCAVCLTLSGGGPAYPIKSTWRAGNLGDGFACV